MGKGDYSSRHVTSGYISTIQELFLPQILSFPAPLPFQAAVSLYYICPRKKGAPSEPLCLTCFGNQIFKQVNSV